jgi:hypothetical protein
VISQYQILRLEFSQTRNKFKIIFLYRWYLAQKEHLTLTTVQGLSASCSNCGTPFSSEEGFLDLPPQALHNPNSAQKMME